MPRGSRPSGSTRATGSTPSGKPSPSPAAPWPAGAAAMAVPDRARLPPPSCWSGCGSAGTCRARHAWTLTWCYGWQASCCGRPPGAVLRPAAGALGPAAGCSPAWPRLGSRPPAGRLPLVLRSRITPAGERLTFGLFPGPVGRAARRPGRGAARRRPRPRRDRDPRPRPSGPGGRRRDPPRPAAGPALPPAARLRRRPARHPRSGRPAAARPDPALPHRAEEVAR